MEEFDLEKYLETPQVDAYKKHLGSAAEDLGGLFNWDEIERSEQTPYNWRNFNPLARMRDGYYIDDIFAHPAMRHLDNLRQALNQMFTAYEQYRTSQDKNALAEEFLKASAALSESASYLVDCAAVSDDPLKELLKYLPKHIEMIEE